MRVNQARCGFSTHKTWLWGDWHDIDRPVDLPVSNSPGKWWTGQSGEHGFSRPIPTSGQVRWWASSLELAFRGRPVDAWCAYLRVVREKRKLWVHIALWWLIGGIRWLTSPLVLFDLFIGAAKGIRSKNKSVSNIPGRVVTTGLFDVVRMIFPFAYRCLLVFRFARSSKPSVTGVVRIRVHDRLAPRITRSRGSDHQIRFKAG